MNATITLTKGNVLQTELDQIEAVAHDRGWTVSIQTSKVVAP